MKMFKQSWKSPAEKDAVRKGIIVALLTENLLFGWLFAKKYSKYDFEKRRLK